MHMAKPARPNVPLVISEHGLSSRYERGEIEVVHDAADPEQPNVTVSRARRVCVYDRLAARDAITEFQREAADKYAVLREQETGASWQNGELVATNRSPWQKGHPSQTAVGAAAEMRRVHATLGKRGTAIVHALVVENCTPEQIGLRYENACGDPTAERVVRAWVVAYLERLVELWSLDD